MIRFNAVLHYDKLLQGWSILAKSGIQLCWQSCGRGRAQRGQIAVRNPPPPKDMKATLDDCDKLHQARRWELAQDCYSGALRLIMNKTKASEKHFEEQVKGFTAAWGGERGVKCKNISAGGVKIIQYPKQR